MSLVGKRYAEALIGLSLEKGKLEEDRRQLGFLVDLYSNQSDLKELFLNPRISREEKKTVLTTLFEKELEPNIFNFTMLLVDKDRIKFLPDIYREFMRLADIKGNVMNMTVVSAMPLEDYQIDKIREKYKKVYNASTINLEMRLDSSLLGGIKIIIGDKVIDGTMSRRLENLKNEILGN